MKSTITYNDYLKALEQLKRVKEGKLPTDEGKVLIGKISEIKCILQIK